MSQKGKNSDKPLAHQVGEIIAIRRKAKGWTQAQLAEYMDIEKESVSRMENGYIAPSLARLEQIAKLMDCDAIDLLKIDPPNLDDQVSALANRMEGLSDSQKAILLTLLGKVTGALVKLNAKDRKVVEKFLEDIL